MTKLGKIQCPSCGSGTGIQILRGPSAPRAKKRAARSPVSTRYYCIRCGFEWSEDLRK